MHRSPVSRSTPLRAALMLCAATALSSCPHEARPPEASAVAAYTPGLGEIMTLQQMRHLKLWYAGQAGNWDLALYEVDELGEDSTTW